MANDIKTQAGGNAGSVSRAETLKAINAIHNRLMDALDNISWSHIYSDYVEHNRQEEKRHVEFIGRTQRGITISDASKLFAVIRILEYYLGRDAYGGRVKAPSVKDYLSYNKTVFEAYAIVANYRKNIKKALKDIPKDQIEIALKADYCKLVE